MIRKLFLTFILTLSLIGNCFAAYTYDTKANNARTNANPVSFSYTCGAGATVLVLSLVCDAARAGGAPTYNNIAMTQASTGQTSAETYVEEWYLLNPLTGSAYTISIPNSGTVWITSEASSYKAASGYGSFLRTDGGATGVSTNPTGPTHIGLAIGDVIVAVVGSGAQTWASTARTGTQLYDVDDGTYGDGAQYLIKTDANNTAMSWTFGTSDDWAIVSAVFGEQLGVIPTVTTQSCTDVTANSATGNGNITDTGGFNPTTRGFCYMLGTTGDPTTANSTAFDTGSFGTGAYTKSITGLSAGTNYRVRAYAINSAGTGYGITVQLLTTPAAPTGVLATDGTYTDKVTVTWTKSTGATGYRVYRDGGDVSGLLGDVATYDDTGAAAPTITAGTASATDGTSTSSTDLSITGESANNGTTHTYKVVAVNSSGNSPDSLTDTGYRGVGALTYQWQVSAADSDATYSNITGATTDPYSYTGAPAPSITPGTASATDGTSTSSTDLSITGESANVGAGRYYKCVLNATGATQQTSTSDRGYRNDTLAASNGYEIFSDTVAGGSYATSEGLTSASPFDDTALASNTRKYYKVKAKSTAGTWSSLSTAYDGKYTFADTPVPAAATDITGTSIRFNWTSGGTQQDYSYGTTDQTLDGTTTNTYLDVSGLNPYTTYTRYVAARNGDNIKTSAIALTATTSGALKAIINNARINNLLIQ